MAKPAAPATAIDLDIEALGEGGDGIATLDGKRLHVPWTLPGDRVRVVPGRTARAVPLDWLRRSPDHATPPCPHFRSCGGCALQHLDPAAYRSWKLDRARRAAQRAGFPDAAIDPLVVSPPGSRRRATLAAVRSAAGPRLGFHAPASNDIVDIGGCSVLDPDLAAFIAPLRHALGTALAPSQRLDIALTATTTGLDIVAIGALSAAALAPLAALPGVARLTRSAAADRDPDLVALHRAPRILFDGIPAEPPAGAFLQATIAGEAAIRVAVDAALGPARRVADLFAGCGTLSLPLARTRQVLAIDSSRPALEALDRAARAAGLGSRVTIAARDLDRRPLIDDELDDIDAVVFDPPREGALAQAEALARSRVARVVAVSCNPLTFARDAAALAAGGYRLERLTPIDQFLWSPHLELVGAFVRPRGVQPRGARPQGGRTRDRR